MDRKKIRGKYVSGMNSTAGAYAMNNSGKNKKKKGFADIIRRLWWLGVVSRRNMLGQ